MKSARFLTFLTISLGIVSLLVVWRGVGPSSVSEGAAGSHGGKVGVEQNAVPSPRSKKYGHQAHSWPAGPGEVFIPEHRRMAEVRRSLSGDVVEKLTLVRGVEGRGPIRMWQQLRVHVGGAEERLDLTLAAADRLLVLLKEGVTADGAVAFAKELGAEFRVADGTGRRGAVWIQAGDVDDLEQWTKKLEGADSPFEEVEPDYVKFLAGLPADDQFPLQWYLSNEGQTGGRRDADVDAPEAWEISTGDGTVTVAVIDSGVTAGDAELDANLWRNPGEIPGNGVDDDENQLVDDVFGWNFITNQGFTHDIIGHGSAVAALVGARMNGSGMVGVCPNVKIMPLVAFFKDEDLGFIGAYVSDLVASMDYAVSQGARVINASYGSPQRSRTESAAISRAQARGVIVVAAAGNNVANNDARPIYPASYPQSNVISVAASDALDRRATFSNYGARSVDLAAPGVGMPMWRGGVVVSFDSGTSFAAPLVSGAAALLMQTYPQLTAAEVKMAILQNVDRLPNWSGRVASGGRLNLEKALRVGVTPILEMVSTSLKDGKLAGADGNGDGVIGEGETITLGIGLKNIGPVTSPAARTEISLIEGNGVVTILKGIHAWGSIPRRTTVNNLGRPFVLAIAPGSNGTTFTLRFTHSDGQGRSWSNEKTYTITPSHGLIARVVYAATGKPVPKVTVKCSGNGTLVTGQTQSDGMCRFILPTGNYEVTVELAGWFSSPSHSVSLTEGAPPIPPVQFTLGRPSMRVTPPALNLTQEEGSVVDYPITIHNDGDGPLTVHVGSTPTGSVVETSAYGLPTYLSGIRAAQAASGAATLPFFESFENGTLSGWRQAKYRGYWFGSYSLPSGVAKSGNRCLSLRMNAPNGAPTGWYRPLRNKIGYADAPVKPGYLGCWVKTATLLARSGRIALGDLSYDDEGGRTYSDPISIQIAETGCWMVNGLEITEAPAVIPGQWHRVELREIDWNTGLCRFYVDGELARANVPFNRYANTTFVLLSSFSTQSQVWWDGIAVSESYEGWLDAHQDAIVVQARSSLEVPVTVDTRGLLPGIFKSQVDVRGNAVVRPRVTVPLTLKVTPRANTAPVALNSTTTLPEDTLTEVQLTAQDAENDPLRYRLTRLPVTGKLWLESRDAGPATRQVVTSVPIGIPPSVRLLYEPPSNLHGSPLAAVGFRVYDWRAESSEGTVSLVVTAVNDGPQALDDSHVGQGGSSVTMGLLANDFDVDGDALRIIAVSQPARGSVQILPTQTQVLYTPEAGFVAGEDSFNYTIADTGGLTSMAHVRVSLGELYGGWNQSRRDAAGTNFHPGGLHGKTLIKRWSLGISNLSQPLISAGDRVYVCPGSGGDDLCAVDTRTGTLVWKISGSLGGSVRSLVATEDRVVALFINSTSQARHYLLALSAADGTTLWTRQVISGSNARGPGSNLLLVGNELYYSVPYGGQPMVVDLETGEIVRQYAMEGLDGVGTIGHLAFTPFGLLGSGSSTVALRNATGEGWSYSMGSSSSSGLATNGRYAYVRSSNGGGSMLHLDPALPRVAWSLSGGGACSMLPEGIVRTSGVSGFKRRMWDGALLHRYDAPESVDEVVTTPDTVFLASSVSFKVFVFDAASATPRQTLDGVSRVILSGGSVFTRGSNELARWTADDSSKIAPAAYPATWTTDEDESLTGTLTAQINTPGRQAHFIIHTLPAVGTLYQNDPERTPITTLPARVTSLDGSLVYVPPSDLHGSPLASFTFCVSDGELLSGLATITLQVNSVPDAPRPNADRYHVTAGRDLTDFTPLANDADPDGDSLILQSFTQPTEGTLISLPNGRLRFLPPPLFQAGREVSFTYTVADPTGRTASETVVLAAMNLDDAVWPHTYGPANGSKARPIVMHAPFIQCWEAGSAVIPASRSSLSAVTGGGKLYYVANQSVIALDLTTGIDVWSTASAGTSRITIAYGQEKLFVLEHSSPTMTLLCLESETGAEVWRVDAGAYRSHNHLYWSTKGIYLVNEAKLWRFDLATGAKSMVRPQIIASSHFVISGDTAVITTGDAYNSILECIDLPSSQTIWQTSAKDLGHIAAHDGKLFLIRVSGSPQHSQLVCLDLATGGPLWVETRSGGLWGLAANNGVVATSMSSKMYLCSSSTGRPIAEVQHPNPYSYLSAQAVCDDVVITSEGRIFDLRDRSLSGSIGADVLMADGGSLLLGPTSTPVRCLVSSDYLQEAPLAASSQIDIPEGGEATFTLSASQASSLPIKFVVRALPSGGKLFQYNNGGRGEQIVSVPTQVTDPQARLVYRAPLDMPHSGPSVSVSFTAHSRYAPTSATAHVSFSIQEVPDAPLAFPDWLPVQPGQASGDVYPLANDRDPDRETLSLHSFGQPQHGVVSPLPGGGLRYTRNPGSTATEDQIIYQVQDITGRRSSSVVKVLINSRLGLDWLTTGAREDFSGYVPGTFTSRTIVQAWTRQGRTHGVPPLIGDGRVYSRDVTTDHSHYFIFAKDINTGSDLWSVPFPQLGINSNSVTSLCWKDGRLWCRWADASSTSKLATLNSATGAFLWTKNRASVPQVVPFDNVCFVSAYLNSSIYFEALNPQSGSAVYSTSPAIGVVEGMLVSEGSLVGITSDKIVSLDASTGSQRWSLPLPSGFTTRAMVAGDGKVCVTREINQQRTLICIDLLTGSISWQVAIPYVVSPVVAYGLVFYATPSSVTARSLDTGEIWAVYPVPFGGGRLAVTDDLLVHSGSHETHLLQLPAGNILHTLPTSGYLALTQDWLVTCSPYSSGTLTAYRMETPPQLAASRGAHFQSASSVSMAHGADASPQMDAPFRIESATRSSADEAVLSWQSAQGHTYVVECSTDMRDWTDVSDAITGTGSVIHHVVPLDPKLPTCFFRIRKN